MGRLLDFKLKVMALIKCPECEKDVSASALSCPNCGHPIAASAAAEQPPQPRPTPERASETLGVLLIAAPLAAAALSWFWITQLRLIDNPASKLGLITIFTALITAVFATIESGQLGIGNKADIERWKNRKEKTGTMKPPSPITWLFGMALLWIFVYPAYLYYRSKYGAKNLVGAGLFAMLLLLGTTGYVYTLIDDAHQNLNQQIKRDQQELKRMFR